jgi:hypothetical protein
MELTQTGIYILCRKVGFPPRSAKIASAIALCEAPVWNTDVPKADFSMIGDQDLADETWGFSYGGFQIRSLRAHKGTGLPRDEDRLLRPRFNARSALTIRRQSGWNAWSTYKSGMYKAYLQDLFPPTPGTYIVVAGDSLSKIAAKFGTFTVLELALKNNITGPDYKINIGQVLLLP